MKNLSLHQIVWYFFIYSILGMVLENIFCFVTSLHIESRKGLLIGPFCPIYGVGSILFTFFLNINKGNKIKVFFLGLFIGTVFEYISSFTLQAIYGVKFWDYSYQFLNLNGRTSLLYSVSWGILALFLIYYLNPKINKFIRYFNYKSLDKTIIIYMCINSIITYSSLCKYISKAERKTNNKETYIQNDSIIITTKVMTKTFPNLIYVINDEKSVLIKDIF